MAHPQVAAILKLSVAERLEIVQEIWDSIAQDPEAFEVTDEQRRDLERRLAAADADPNRGAPWGMVRERIRRPRG